MRGWSRNKRSWGKNRIKTAAPYMRHTIAPKLVVHNERHYYRVSRPSALGGGKMFFPPTAEGKKEADAECRKLERQRMSGASRFAGLTPSTQNALMLLIDKLEAIQGPKPLADKIREAGDIYERSAARTDKTVADVARECVEAKTKAGNRTAYLAPFKKMLERFASHCGPRLMSEVTLQQVESFINSEKVRSIWDDKGNRTFIPDGPSSLRTRKNRRIDLGTLFSFAVQRGYCTEILPLKTEKIRLDEKEPGILPVEQCKKLLRECMTPQWKHLMPFVALGLFGGLRPSEAQQLEWGNIGDGEIRIVAGRGKKRANRFVTINPTLRAFLALGGELPIKETKSRKARELLKRICARDGVAFTWPADGLRHSFVSYSFAIHGEHHTAKEAGHRTEVMHKNYKALVTRDSAEKFWRLLPEDL